MPLFVEQLQQLQLQEVYEWQGSGKSKKAQEAETMVVGIGQVGEESEALSWAICTAAKPGDSIIALHVQRAQDDDREEEGDKFALLKMLDPFLAHCTKKQIKVSARMASGDAVGKVVLEQAGALKATVLLLGGSGRTAASWCDEEVARYCAEHAPSRCAVLVVKKSKVVALKQSCGREQQVHNRCSGVGLGKFFCAQQPEVVATPMDTPSPSRSHSPERSRDGGRLVVWEEVGEGMSPRGVLEGGAGSRASSPASLSRRPFLSPDHLVPSPLATLNQQQQQQQRGMVWKNLSIRRLHSFPSTYRVKRMLTNSSCGSARSSNSSNLDSISSDSGPDDNMEPSFPQPPSSRPPWRSFSFQEIALATNFFHNDNLVGKGGYAQVFKGVLANGEVIAVKKLTRESEELKERDFLTELGIIGHVFHKNTSMLIGFCIQGGLHLVYKYSPHGSVASLLHGSKGMDWSGRYKVAVGVAHGLHYLHKRCPRRIIHRDIKSSNILLGPDLEPQISDFGLAKWLPEQWTHHTVEPVEGTIGYLAPEYFMHGIVDEKTDVFAFGVLLLELITGRRPVDDGGHNLVIWAKPHLEANNVQELVDRRLGAAYDAAQLRKLMMAATLCVRHSAIWRPSMKQVLELLMEDAMDSDAVSEDWSKLVSRSMDCDDAASHLEGQDYSRDKYQTDLCRHRELALSL